jgi:hypothetical protein
MTKSILYAEKVMLEVLEIPSSFDIALSGIISDFPKQLCDRSQTLDRFRLSRSGINPSQGEQDKMPLR